MMNTNTLSAENPFALASTLPYGLPDFRAILAEHFLPAFEAGFSEQLQEVEAIVRTDEAPSFENTIEALERSGRLLMRVASVFYNLTSADNQPELEAIEAEVAQKMAEHNNTINLNPELFARIQAVHENLDSFDLSDEQRYITERHYRESKLEGAGLDQVNREKLGVINGKLAVLSTTFEQNLVNDTNDLAVIVDSVQELDGLDSADISALAEAAKDRGLDGKFLIALELPTSQQILSSLKNRDLRQRIERAAKARSRRGNEYDNSNTVLDIVRLRAERAELLGFKNHAEVITAGETSGTPEAVNDLLSRLARVAAKNATRESLELQKQITADGYDFSLQSYDWAFYSEKTRIAQYNVDTGKFRPYFEAERVLLDGVFFAATTLFGLEFEERKDLKGYNDDVVVYEVTRDGHEVGLYLLDLYTRDTKRGGAWMNTFVDQNKLLGEFPVVTNNLNVNKPPQGEPTLLNFYEVNTLFHEFGHALHALLSDVVYPTGSGTNVYRDFVEFPSQVNEMWMLWPEVLDSYATHYQTGEKIPQEWVQALKDSSTFNEGFATSEYLASAILDQHWHLLSLEEANAVTDVQAFEASALQKAGLDNPLIPTRYSSCYFAHTFAGGYSAGYYSYIWSEVLDADAEQWFIENGGLTRENGEKFGGTVLSVGGSRDPLSTYRDFRGRDADLSHLLSRRGLVGS